MRRPRIALGAISHETNSFSSVPTTFSDFERHACHQGGDIIDQYRGTGSVVGGIIDAADALGADLVPTLAAYAVPGGIVTRDALDTLLDRLCRQLTELEGAIDGVLLDLHGAMVSEVDLDGEGYVLARVRQRVGDELPIVAVIDSHANITSRMARLATMLVGYQSYPHTDMAERGAEAVEHLLGAIDGRRRPRGALVNLPLLSTLPGQHTGRAPMREIARMAREIAQRVGVINVTLAPGFPYADTPDTGFSILVTTDGDPALASSLARELAATVWERRRELVQTGVNIEEAVHRAMPAARGPVVLADQGDNPGAGAPGDGTGLLWGLLDLGARGAALALIADPEAVERAVEAGIDAEVELRVGAKTDRLHGYPIDVSGRVARIADGRFRRDGPMGAGLPVDLGRSVVLDARARHDGNVEIILCERRRQPFDLSFFRHHGIEPEGRKILAVKSSVHFRAAFEPIAAEIIDVATPGITTTDFGFFAYQRLRRPIFPLDDH